MQPGKICKTIHQYNKEPVSPEDMQRLLEIAQDYRDVKNYVYQRYGSIKSLPKLYPGYTVQNEMTESGLRAQLGLPAVYFYLAVFDALGDIKAQWAKTKNGILASINRNERLTPQDRHYLRFVLRTGGCFDNILNGRAVMIPEAMKEQYDCIIADVNSGTISGAVTDTDKATGKNKDSVENLNRYLCRQVRRKLHKMHTDKADGFNIAERAYRYGWQGKKHGIFISTKESRKRIFVPLTDENEYKKQLYIRLRPEKNGIEISVPVETKIRVHKDFTNEIGLSAGIWQMFTTDAGNVYGERFGELHRELVDYMRSARQTYNRERKNNPGRVKYRTRKAKLDARLETYVNQEINRMLAAEKPKIIYIPKLPGSGQTGYSRKINYSMGLWRKGFIRNRLELKCREHSVGIVEVIGRAISTECSRCGAAGTYSKDIFRCGSCGYEADKKVNAARNALKRGRTGQTVNDVYVPAGGYLEAAVKHNQLQ